MIIWVIMKSYIWMGAVILILIGLMAWGVKTASTGPVFDLNVISAVDHVEGLPAQTGNVKSPVIIMEYSDFECPACRNYYFVMREIMVQFGDKISFVYRHFPLTEIHANSEFAARVAEAAGKQGKFWEMHNLLFEKQDEWAKAANPGQMFESYATLLGISVEKFKTDIASKEVADLVKAERASALKLGLPGTPSFFINGKQIQNPASVDAFKTVVSDALKNK
jgi:protein-disulfide isomerase